MWSRLLAGIIEGTQVFLVEDVLHQAEYQPSSSKAHGLKCLEGGGEC